MKQIEQFFGTFVLATCLWLLPTDGQAQITYQLTIDSIVGIPDTVVDGEEITVFMIVSSSAPLFYEGNFYVELEYAGDFFEADTSMVPPNAFLGPNSPVQIQATHRLSTDDGLSIGDNVVVVWPKLGNDTVPDQEVQNPYTTTITLVEPNGIKDRKGSRVRRSFIFPNPTEDRVAFNLNIAEQVSSTVVCDMAGREILRTAATNGLDVSVFRNGIYLVEVQTKSGVVYYDRMIVNH